MTGLRVPEAWLRAIWPAAKLGAAVIAFPILVVIAAAEGVRTRRRRAQGARPRLMWGPQAIIAIRDWSRSLQALGYDSVTFADAVAVINRREDFDVHRDEFLPGVPRADLARDYFVFVWALRRADVFSWYFHKGYLTFSGLAWLECWLLHLAGKKIIVSPFGGDIAVVGEIGVMEPWLLQDYPELVDTSAAARRRIVHLCRNADLVIRNYQYGFLPRADALWPTMIAIDADQWDVAEADGIPADGHTGEVVVVHAPNHRGIKGTQQLIDAIEQLQAEGLRVRLDLIEGRPNEEVRAAMRRADIVADQFIAGYALFAIEGMSTGKPVLSALAWMPPEVAHTPALRACPIVDTDVSNLVGNLRGLIVDPARRLELGRAGREFVLRYHAYEPVARTWSALIDHVWSGLPLPVELTAPLRIAPAPSA
jgi:glycosyltransferase involved in cell wall biosynthesis